RVLLPTISEWHFILTTFSFAPRENRTVQLDILSSDNILYRGDVGDHFLNKDGELSGILLRNAQRFQYDKLKRHRQEGIKKDAESYWKPVAGGGSFYIPASNISSLNARYVLPNIRYREIVSKVIRNIGTPGRLSNIKVEWVPRPKINEIREEP